MGGAANGHAPNGENGHDRPACNGGEEVELSYFTEFTTYFAYTLLIAVGARPAPMRLRSRRRVAHADA